MYLTFVLYVYHVNTVREMNKTLYDSNDGLRSELANEVIAAKRRVSALVMTNFFILTGSTTVRS